jgi:NAD(P)-dependent dehydrogenase (short-subunit alcohol dehydrogenase family)
LAAGTDFGKLAQPQPALGRTLGCNSHGYRLVFLISFIKARMQTQRVALITGANRGIGFETAKQLGEQGITVVLAARQLVAAQKATVQLKAQGIDAHAIQLDVTKPAERTAAMRFLTSTLGQLDILVNNAGMVPKETLTVPRTIETTPEEFQEIFDTNFFSVVALTREVMPLLCQSPAGRIVNLSSNLGSLTEHAQPGNPLGPFQVLSYSASKAALNMFTVLLAHELADTNIKVNSAHPGWVKTEIGGGDVAPLTVAEGSRTSVELALLGADGPTGHFIHLGKELPW